MNRKLYPKNWDAIALAIKNAADWHCQQCGRPCRRPSETNEELIGRLTPEWQEQCYQTEEDEEFGSVEVPKFGRFTLTVAHLNHIPEDCRTENLKALCSVCHTRYDLSQMAVKRRLKREREGQLRLPL